MEQNYFQKMSGAIAAAESLRYIGLSLDEVGSLCDVPAPLLEATMHSINPEILPLRERLRGILKGDPASVAVQARRSQPVKDFKMELKPGVRPSSYKKYADTVYAYATSTRSLQRICRENGVPCSNCRSFMMRYYPEAAQRHIDVLEGRFAVSEQPETQSTQH